MVHLIFHCKKQWLMKTTSWMFALLLWVGLLSTTFAQGLFSLGVKGGVTATKLALPDGLDQVAGSPDFSFVADPVFGLVGEWQVLPALSLQSELNFSTKGFRLQQEGDFQLFGVSVPAGVAAYSRFHYLEMPLLAKLSFGKGGVRGYVGAGPVVGYALDGRLNTRATVLVELDLTDTPIDLERIDYRRFEAGVAASAGVALEALHGQFFLDGRFQHGLTEVYDLPLIRDRLQFRGLSLTAGYMYRF